MQVWGSCGVLVTRALPLRLMGASLGVPWAGRLLLCGPLSPPRGDCEPSRQPPPPPSSRGHPPVFMSGAGMSS